VLCVLAAIVILPKQEAIDPRSTFRGIPSRPQFHGCIWDAHFSPDGRKLLFRVNDESEKYSRDDTYLYVLEDKSIRKLPIARNSQLAYSPWSPDSKHITVLERNECNLFNIETNTVTKQFRVILREWSPDGTKQLFENPLTRDTYLRNVEEGTWTVLPAEVSEAVLPCWNRDCTSLFYYDRERKKIMQYNIRAEDLTELKKMEGYHDRFFPILVPSRNADFVYFTTPRPNSDSRQLVILRRLNLRTRHIETLFKNEGGVSKPFLSPNRNYLYIYCYEPGQDDQMNKSFIRFDIRTRTPETLMTGPYHFRDYSGKSESFLLGGKDLRTLYLFDPSNRKLEHIYPPEQPEQT
jgi:Tol biopolymer transport system component